jgi:hypothetical protein
MAAFLVILAFATTTPVVLWDRSVLSESLALSGLALLFAASIRLSQQPSLARAVALVIVALCCALARDTEILLPALLGILLVVFALIRRASPRFRLLALTGCALLLAAGFCTATVIESGRETLNTKDNLYVRVFPYPARVAWFASHGMPEARQIDDLAKSQSPPTAGAAPTVFPDLTSPRFGRLSTWITHNGASTYALWEAVHPWLFFFEPLRRPQQTFDNANGSVTGYAAQNRVTSGLSPLLWPPWVAMCAIVAATVVVANERNLSLDRTAHVVIVLGLIGIPAVLSAWNGDGQETTRHTLEGLAQIHLGVLIMFVYVVLARPPSQPDMSSLRDTQRDAAVELPGPATLPAS